jgi:hypothetical protein
MHKKHQFERDTSKVSFQNQESPSKLNEINFMHSNLRNNELNEFSINSS